MKRLSRSMLLGSNPADERQWHRALSMSPIPLGVIRMNGKSEFIFFNKAFTRTTGYSISNAPTLQSWARQAFPNRAYREATFGNWSKCVLGRPMTRPYQHKVKVRTAFGTDIHAICNTMRSGDMAVVCFTDITESETQLERLHTVIDALPYPLALEEYRPGKDNRNPRFVLMNQNFQDRLGYNSRMCPRMKDLLKHIYPERAYRNRVYQGWLRACARQEEGKKIGPLEAQARSSSGATLNILISTILLKDIGIRLVALTDITPQKRLIDALERENLTAENQRDVLRKRLRSSLTAASVAHEIDTSLGAILLQTKSALRDLLKEPKRNAAMISPLQNILNQAEGINLTIDRIRALISNMDTRHEPVDLRGVIQSALLSLKDRLKSNGIEVVTRHFPGQATLIGDETQIYLIVLNLLRNSIDALSRKKLRRRVVRIHVVSRNGGFAITVEDSGTGLSSEAFRRFARWNARESGMGLGLFLVRSAVENHRGKIQFGRSRLKGWKVSVWLPVAPPQKFGVTS